MPALPCGPASTAPTVTRSPRPHPRRGAEHPGDPERESPRTDPRGGELAELRGQDEPEQHRANATANGGRSHRLAGARSAEIDRVTSATISKAAAHGITTHGSRWRPWGQDRGGEGRQQVGPGRQRAETELQRDGRHDRRTADRHRSDPSVRARHREDERREEGHRAYGDDGNEPILANELTGRATPRPGVVERQPADEEDGGPSGDHESPVAQGEIGDLRDPRRECHAPRPRHPGHRRPSSLGCHGSHGRDAERQGEGRCLGLRCSDHGARQREDEGPDPDHGTEGSPRSHEPGRSRLGQGESGQEHADHLGGPTQYPRGVRRGDESPASPMRKIDAGTDRPRSFAPFARPTRSSRSATPFPRTSPAAVIEPAAAEIAASTPTWSHPSGITSSVATATTPAAAATARRCRSATWYSGERRGCDRDDDDRRVGGKAGRARERATPPRTRSERRSMHAGAPASTSARPPPPRARRPPPPAKRDIERCGQIATAMAAPNVHPRRNTSSRRSIRAETEATTAIVPRTTGPCRREPPPRATPRTRWAAPWRLISISDRRPARRSV